MIDDVGDIEGCNGGDEIVVDLSELGFIVAVGQDEAEMHRRRKVAGDNAGVDDADEVDAGDPRQRDKEWEDDAYAHGWRPGESPDEEGDYHEEYEEWDTSVCDALEEAVHRSCANNHVSEIEHGDYRGCDIPSYAFPHHPYGIRNGYVLQKENQGDSHRKRTVDGQPGYAESDGGDYGRQPFGGVVDAFRCPLIVSSALDETAADDEAYGNGGYKYGELNA